MKKLPDFFELSASSKAIKKEVLEDVFPKFNQNIEAVEKALTLVFNQIMHDQELMNKSYVSSYVKFRNASVETHLSMAKSSMSCIKSWFERYPLITEKDEATIESLLQTTKEAIVSAESIMEVLKKIYERKEILFQQESPGSEQVS